MNSIIAEKALVYNIAMKHKNREYFHSIIFGVEDSLVSTTGLIAGLSVSTQDKSVVLVGAVVALAVEAISMGSSEYISDDSITSSNPAASGFLMFASYLLAGLIPLIPMVTLAYPTSLVIAVLGAFMGLALLGYVKSKFLKTNPIKGALKVLAIGGITTLIGVAVGLLFKV